MYFVFLFFSFFSQGEVIFPKNDSYSLDKKNLLEEFQSLMPAGGSAGYVVASDKIFLWANSVPSSLVFPEKEDDKDITVPLFVANTLQKEAQLRLFIKEQCDCDIDNRSIGGIIVAHPWQAATMYFKKGWLGHDADDIDGVVPPIVIIYHEFSHASDFIKSQDYFFDMAGISSKQWNNEAEKSAVNQQNDLVHSIAQKKNLFFGLRRSYGKNTLFAVSDIYSVTPIDAN